MSAIKALISKLFDPTQLKTVDGITHAIRILKDTTNDSVYDDLFTELLSHQDFPLLELVVSSECRSTPHFDVPHDFAFSKVWRKCLRG